MFGNYAEISQLKMRVHTLEDAVATQQRLINELLSATGLADSIPASLLRAPDELHPDVMALLREGKPIAAIKRHREFTGLGLKDAKDAIDAARAKYNL